ncbi:MAG: phosphoglycerate kinase [Fimbriimonadaceae bacterium]|nr:phosphoglycerate kinase [Fimbriimonadaceae bacterium]
MKRTVTSLDGLQGQTVLVRVDFNVPLQNGVITDDSRIRAAVPTLQYLLGQGAKLVLCAHFERPQVAPIAKWPGYSLAPTGVRLSELLGQPVQFAYNCVGKDTDKAKKALQPGEVLLLENTRFHSGEEWNSPDFAKKLAAGCTVFVNDAFGAAHRAHGSTVGVTEFLKPAVMGYLVERELQVLNEVLATPKEKLTVVLGGKKVSDKIGVVKKMLEIAGTVIIGGGMGYTFLKAAGHEIGTSLLDAESLEQVKAFQAYAADPQNKVCLLTPTDVVVAPEFGPDAPATVVAADQMPADQQGLDLGPATRAAYVQALQEAQMVFWNGPMGVFEFDRFAAGTNALAWALAEGPAKAVIGGGDSGAAVVKAGVADRMYHNCTGGGASLEFLQYGELDGINALTDVAG